MPGPGRITVGVAPADVTTSHQRLLAALAAAYPVSFVGRDPGNWAGVDAVLIVGAPGGAAPDGLPTLVFEAPERRDGAQLAIRLAAGAPLHRALRGAVIHDVPPPALGDGRSDAVLAAHDDGPVWRQAEHVAHAAWFPAELDPEEPLRARLGLRRSVALLPLVHLLDGLTRELAWRPVPQGAAFILDDPNLHTPRYGHVRFAQVAEHADRHGHHVVMAMVPLDAWFAHPKAVALFRESPDRLSLALHGTEHDGAELGRVTDPETTRRTGLAALRRIARFEDRTGVPVARVMVPPHEALSEAAATGLVAAGVAAFCAAQPYPWETSRDDWLSAAPGAGPLTGWERGFAAGAPMLLRHPFDFPDEDLAFRTFLGHPLIIYGHHQDLKDGLEPFAHWAGLVRDRGVEHWENLDALTRRAVECRRTRELLEVRPLAPHVDVEVPDGVSAVRVVGRDGEVAHHATVAADHGALAAPGDPDEPWALPKDPPGLLRVSLTTRAAPAPEAVRHRPHPRAVVRRVVTELRDRLGGASS